MKSGQQIITYWICPAGPARSQCAALIQNLAARFDAPAFEPHVTIYVVKADSEDPNAVLETVLKGRGPFRLSVRGLEYSDKFTKTLFVQFAPEAELAQLSQDLGRASVSQTDYKLNPHLRFGRRNQTRPDAIDPPPVHRG